MFTQLEEREVITSGVRETNEFRIKANGKAFKILIDGLYSSAKAIQKLALEASDRGLYAQEKDLSDIATKLKKTADLMALACQPAGASFDA